MEGRSQPFAGPALACAGAIAAAALATATAAAIAAFALIRFFHFAAHFREQRLNRRILQIHFDDIDHYRHRPTP